MGRHHEQGRIKTLKQGTLYQSVRWKQRTDFLMKGRKMKLLAIASATIFITAFGAYTGIDQMSAEQQTRMEIKADAQFYSSEIIYLPANDPSAKVPKKLLKELEKANNQEDV